jgi:DNA (cytosine-5)-methyltransferase 1
MNNMNIRPKKDPINIVSLFCGCGGLDVGFKQEGFKNIYACDIDTAAVDSYSQNIDSSIYQRDIRSTEFRSDIRAIGRCNIVLGGFPCQGFSKAGPKKKEDDRNSLYHEMLWAISELQPQVFLAENVDGLSQNYNGIFLKKIVDDFLEIGYTVEYRIVDAAGFGVPQHRRRIFFIGINKSINKTFEWPKETHDYKIRNGEFKIQNNGNQSSLFDDLNTSANNLLPALSISDAISDLINLDDNIPDHKVLSNWPKKYNHVFRMIGQGQKLCNVRHSPSSVYTWEIPEVYGYVSQEQKEILEIISKNRRHKRYGDIPNGNPLPLDEIERLLDKPVMKQDILSLIDRGYLKIIDNKYDLKGAMFCSGHFKRPLWNETSPTILTNFYNPRYFLHPLEDRPFSLRECARLQSFPDNFIFTDGKYEIDLISAYRLVGNAVPPALSRAFAKSIASFLTSFISYEVELNASPKI